MLRLGYFRDFVYSDSVCYTGVHMKNPWVVVGIITVILFGGAIWYSSMAGEKSNEGVTITDHIKGPENAAVTLTEYSDFQCPACGAFEPVVAELLQKYSDKIKFEYKHYPLPIHTFAQQAAAASEAAAQQDKFFEYHDKLFANQQTWSTSQTPQTFFVQYAEELGLDVEKFKRHQKSAIIRDAIKTDFKEAQDLGLTGTPTFFLNGQKMEMESYEDFVAQITAAVDPQAANLQASSSSSSAPQLSAPEIKFGI